MIAITTSSSTRVKPRRRKVAAEETRAFIGSLLTAVSNGRRDAPYMKARGGAVDFTPRRGQCKDYFPRTEKLSCQSGLHGFRQGNQRFHRQLFGASISWKFERR